MEQSGQDGALETTVGLKPVCNVVVPIYNSDQTRYWEKGYYFSKYGLIYIKYRHFCFQMRPDNCCASNVRVEENKCKRQCMNLTKSFGFTVGPKIIFNYIYIVKSVNGLRPVLIYDNTLLDHRPFIPLHLDMLKHEIKNGILNGNQTSVTSSG